MVIIGLRIPAGGDPAEQGHRLGLVSLWMAHKGAFAFTLSIEVMSPDALVTIGVAQNIELGFLSLIKRSPFEFEPMRQLAADELDLAIVGMLPSNKSEIAEPLLEELERWFGSDGFIQL